MIDTSKKKWDLSKEEKYAIKWFEENGFNGTLEKQYISKTIFTIEKDGIEDRFELVQGVEGMNVRAYMKQYGKNWDMLCELRRLKRQA